MSMVDSEGKGLDELLDLQRSHSVSFSVDDAATVGSQDTPIPDLHEHLLRNLRRDPYRIYDVLEPLGEGSMGRVEKVKKRQCARGGSARSAFVEDEKRRRQGRAWFECKDLTLFLSLFCPIRSRHEDSDDEMEKGNLRSLSTSSSGGLSGWSRSTSSMITYGIRKDAVFALKSIHLEMVKDDQLLKRELRNEISILRSMDHPNIVKAIETYDFKNHIYLVLEIATGGDLYIRDPYSELQACDLMACIVDAVAYMHSRNIIHRDLKYEQILFTSPDSGEIKIIDFGLSKKYAKEEHLHDAVGTMYTMAPEVILGDYDEKADIWSLGVIVYMLLSSSLPFYGSSRQRVMRRVVKGAYDFESPRWSEVSEEGKIFVKSLLRKDDKQRPTASQVLRSNWLNEHVQIKHRRSHQTSDWIVFDRVQASLHMFASYGRMKKLALLVIAYKSTDEEIGILRRIFRSFDTMSDTGISMDAFKEALKDYQYTEAEIECMFHSIDIDGSGEIHYSEFLAASMEAHGAIDEERIAEAFDLLDSDDSGYITVANLKAFLGKELPDAYLDAIIDEVDIDQDHRISYDEFLSLWDESEDIKLRDSYKKLVHRRQESMDGMSCSTDENSVPEEMKLIRTTSELSSGEFDKGDYFFTVEKHKSIRSM